MFFATGDTHANFRRFSKKNFPEQEQMTRDDIVFIAGDFGGIWTPSSPSPFIAEQNRTKWLKSENYELDVLAKRNPTFCYVLGNHENWNRYDSDEFPIVDFYGGKAHKIRENVYQLMNGYVFNFDGYTVYAFGGASSHDISEGIFDADNYPDIETAKRELKKWKKTKTYFRIKDVSWWERECMPTDEEIVRGWENLEKYNNQVNLVLTHCLPQQVASVISYGSYQPDTITRYLQMVSETVRFDNWVCGHYHQNRTVMGKFHILYEQIVALKTENR